MSTTNVRNLGQRLALAILGLLMLITLFPATPAAAQGDQRCFAETGFCMSGEFKRFWEQNGGLPVFGYPMEGTKTETIEGQSYTVQYFERQRFELHPQNEAPWNVQLGRMGAELYNEHQGEWIRPDNAAWGTMVFNKILNDARSRPNNGRTIGEIVPNFGTQPVLFEGQWVIFFERAVGEYHTDEVGGDGSIVLYRRLGAERLERNAPAPTTPALPCRLDKIGTWSEIEGAQRQRIEVGGGGTQTGDFYNVGRPSVIYIADPSEPGIIMGFGSLWEGNGPECADFDWIGNAKRYAGDRLNNGANGVIVDLRAGYFRIIATGMSHDSAIAEVQWQLDNMWTRMPGGVRPEIRVELR